MIVKKNVSSIEQYLKQRRVNLRKKIAFIPTMGALHEGHLSLIKLAKDKGRYVIVSIYVNPSQFAPNEDFSKYPRTLKSDLEKLNKISVDLVFTPVTKDISEYTHQKYSFKTFGLEKKLCGKFRPNHYIGVSEIVLKFLSIINPDFAYFGEKDYQQYIFIEKIVKQTILKTKIIMGKTIRDKDGLALSSRNKYLSENEKNIAKYIYKYLKQSRLLIKKGQLISTVLKKQKDDLLKLGFSKIEYLEVKDSNLRKSNLPHNKSRIFIAAKINNIRLIDNILI